MCCFYCIFFSSRCEDILFSSRSCIVFFAFYIKVFDPSVIRFFHDAMYGLSISSPYRYPKEPPPFLQHKSFHKRRSVVGAFLHRRVCVSVFSAILAPARYCPNYYNFMIYNPSSSNGVCPPSPLPFKYFISCARPFAFLYKY